MLCVHVFVIVRLFVIATKRRKFFVAKKLIATGYQKLFLLILNYPTIETQNTFVAMPFAMNFLHYDESHESLQSNC